MRNERVHNMKSSQQSITMILGTIALFIGIPLFLDTLVAGIIILLSPIAYISQVSSLVYLQRFKG